MTTHQPPLPTEWKRRLRHSALRWYDQHGRRLPWRETRDPYRIWISEIMLQQTTVAAVVPYFERFLDVFPDVTALAAADESDVLQMWEGLGYYSRARNIHRTSRIITEDRDGVFPEDVESLRELPGIGRYTAGAIVAFAFDRPAPIVEANTLRLYCRLMGWDADPKSSASQKLFWNFAEEILPRKRAGDFNQSLIEIGSQICRPSDPDCDACPLSKGCAARIDDRVAEIPRPSAKRIITNTCEVAVAALRDERYLLRKRPPGERWEGMWDFPKFEVPLSVAPAEKLGTRSERTPDGELRDLIVAGIREQTGWRIEPGRFLSEWTHGVTRFRIRLLAIAASVLDQQPDEPPNPETEFHWVLSEEFENYPLPVTSRKLACLLTRPNEVQRNLFREE